MPTEPNTRTITIQCTIPDSYAGRRLDQALAQLLPEYSRARLQDWLTDGHLLIDNQVKRPRDRVLGGEQVTGHCPEQTNMAIEQAQAQPIDLTIVAEDEELIIINKPAGMVVHPAAGNPDGTLLNALLHHDAALQALPRAGLVHRLDKDTTGLLVVARTLRAHNSLVQQLQARTLGREYTAIVHGLITASATVVAPIGRHLRDRKRMAVVKNGKPAITHYSVVEQFAAHTHLQVKLETGRTHQIRVHMQHIKHPLMGDQTYGKKGQQQQAAGFTRQALHARQLELDHPATGKRCQWQVEMPADMMNLLAVLREQPRC